MYGDPQSQRLDIIEARLRMQDAQIADLRRDAYAYRVESRLREEGVTPSLPVRFRSQFGEDTTLWDLFGGKRDGFFLEVGAYDGKHFSVSYAFEAAGWRGVLIEAIPEAAEQCRANRPGSRVVHAALGGPGHAPTATFTVAQGRELLSYLHTDEHHLRQIRGSGVSTREVTVPVMTMNEVLGEHAGPIDFASIDVEGAEVELLKGFDLERFRPRVLLIEDSTLGADTPVVRFMAERAAYRYLGTVGVNRLYVRADDRDIFDRMGRRRENME